MGKESELTGISARRELHYLIVSKLMGFSKNSAYFDYEKFILTTVSEETDRRFLQLIDVKTSAVLYFNVIAPSTAAV